MNHEGREGREVFHPFSMRLPTPLSPEAEDAMTHVELTARGIAFEAEKAVTVKYRDVEITGQRIDLIVCGLIVVELKAVKRFDDVHRSQVISYLKTTGLKGGLLINFNVPVLKRACRE